MALLPERTYLMSKRVTLLRPETDENGLNDGIAHRIRGGEPPVVVLDLSFNYGPAPVEVTEDG
jgi:hypothetical protein